VGLGGRRRQRRGALGRHASDRARDTDPGVALLPAHPDPAWWSELAQHAMGDRGFERQPHWRGAVAETGALARRAQDPLVAALLAGNARPAARVAARLRELAAALVAPPDPGDPLVGGLSLGDGVGLGWAENARGRLLHLVQIQAGRATLYRIVAPTEWNFHPRGALAAALLGATATDAAALQQRARVLVDGLDPCVACTVEVGDA
jgi:coenzyme F420-reducing hydrogenase alpha subunit